MALRATALGNNGQTANKTLCSITIPSTGVGGTVVAGDIGYALVSNNAPAATITAPSGWALVAGEDAVGGALTASVYRKTLTAGDIGSSASWSSSTSSRFPGAMVILSGDTATGAVVSAVATLSTAGTTITTPTATTGSSPASWDVIALFAARSSTTGASVLTATAGWSVDASSATAFTASPELSVTVGHRTAAGAASTAYGANAWPVAPSSTALSYVIAVPSASTSTPASGSGGLALGGTAASSSTAASASGTGGLSLDGVGSLIAAQPVVVQPNSPGAAAAPPLRPVKVQILTAGYLPWKQVADYQTVSVTWQRLGIGTGTLIVSETSTAAPFLLLCETTIVPVTVTVQGRRWAGRVVTCALDRSGPPGTGTITATLVDDWVWLSAMRASQNGADPSLTGMPQYDTQSGPAATVAAYYINAAATRLGVPVAAVAPTADMSPTIGPINARMQTLADLLTGPLDAAGVVMPVDLWLPGDAQPAGLPADLSRPTLLFSPQVVAAKPWLRWSDSVGGITTVSLVVKAPSAYRQILGLQGDDAARVYDSYTDTGLQAALGPYGLPEAYTDATDIPAVSDDSQARGAQKQTDNAATVSGAVTVTDGQPWSFPEHYDVGDIATMKIAGVGFEQPVTRVTATDNRDAGLTFTPLIGDPTASASSDELIIREVADVALRIRLIETGR